MVVQQVAVGQYASVHVAHGYFYLFVVTEVNPVFPQPVETGLGVRVLHLLLEHKPVRRLRPDKQPAYYKGIILYVGGPEVEGPGNFVERTEQYVIRMFFGKEIAQPAEFLHPRTVRWDLENRCLGNLRPVLPDGVQEIRHAHHMAGGSPFIQFLLELRHESSIHAKAVQRYVNFAFFPELLSQPLRDGHLFRNPHLMQLHPRPFKLPVRLDKVAGVRPQTGMVRGNHHISGLSGKACEPLHLLPPFGRVLTAVGIASGQDDGIPSASYHHRAERRDSCTVIHIRKDKKILAFLLNLYNSMVCQNQIAQSVQLDFYKQQIDRKIAKTQPGPHRKSGDNLLFLRQL